MTMRNASRPSASGTKRRARLEPHVALAQDAHRRRQRRADCSRSGRTRAASSGSASYQSDWSQRTFASFMRSAFFARDAQRAGDRSVPQHFVACGRSRAMASAIAPDPVPRSSTRSGRSARQRTAARIRRAFPSPAAVSAPNGRPRATSPQNSRRAGQVGDRLAVAAPARERENAATSAAASGSVACAISHARSTPSTCASSTCASIGASHACASAGEP